MVDSAISYADEGFLCVESVLRALADLKGFKSDYIPAIATGLAAGVARTSQICGGIRSDTRPWVMVWPRETPF